VSGTRPYLGSGRAGTDAAGAVREVAVGANPSKSSRTRRG
jgi:hypothetical protein